MRRFLLLIPILALAGCGGPKPVEETTGPTNCQVVWVSPGSVTERYDVYFVDMPIADWTSGTKSLQRVPGEQRVAVFAADYDFTTSSYASRAMSTAGSITVTVGGTADGDAVTVADAGGHVFFDADGSDVLGLEAGNGGAASFNGVWSPADAPVPGDVGGQAQLDYHSAPQTVGDYTRFAYCYRSVPQ